MESDPTPAFIAALDGVFLKGSTRRPSIEEISAIHAAMPALIAATPIAALLEDQAAEIARLNARVAELEAAKWDVKHTDTANTLVQMGMARDAAEAALAERDKQIAVLRGALAFCHVEMVAVFANPDLLKNSVSTMDRFAEGLGLTRAALETRSAGGGDG